MCHAILEIRYRAVSQPDETIKVADEAALEQRLDALTKNELIDRIRIFTPTKTLTRNSVWSGS